MADDFVPLSQAKSTRLRDSGRLGFLAVCWTFFVIACVSVASEVSKSPHVVGTGRVVGVSVMVLFAIASLVNVARAITGGVTITQDKVVVRNAFKTYRIERIDVVSVHRRLSGGWVYSGIHLRDGSLVKVDSLRGKNAPSELASALGVIESDAPFHPNRDPAKTNARMLFVAVGDIVLGGAIVAWGAARGLPVDQAIGALIALGSWPMFYAYREQRRRAPTGNAR